MNDETQQQPNGSEAPPQLTSAEQGAAIVEAEQTQQAAPSEAPPQQIADAPNAPVSADPIPPHSAAAAHGVLSKLESELMNEFRKGESSFLSWVKVTIAELKQHIRV